MEAKISASSVSGVGAGSALKAGQKGDVTALLGIERLIGTKIVLSGKVTLDSGTEDVLFPTTLPGVAADYIVLSGGSAAHSYATSVATTGFTMNGTGSQVVSYIVVRLTTATVETN